MLLFLFVFRLPQDYPAIVPFAWDYGGSNSTFRYSPSPPFFVLFGGFAIAKIQGQPTRYAAEMGDLTTLNAIAGEIKKHSDSCIPLSKQFVQLAEDFDLDGVQKLANALDAC